MYSKCLQAELMLMLLHQSLSEKQHKSFIFTALSCSNTPAHYKIFCVDICFYIIHILPWIIPVYFGVWFYSLEHWVHFHLPCYVIHNFYCTLRLLIVYLTVTYIRISIAVLGVTHYKGLSLLKDAHALTYSTFLFMCSFT